MVPSPLRCHLRRKTRVYDHRVLWRDGGPDKVVDRHRRVVRVVTRAAVEVISAAGLSSRVPDGVDLELLIYGSSLRKNCTFGPSNGATRRLLALTCGRSRLREIMGSTRLTRGRNGQCSWQSRV